ncbi:hypothetical protein ACRQTN_14445 [Pectobacterium brasiliense]
MVDMTTLIPHIFEAFITGERRSKKGAIAQAGRPGTP